MLKTGTYPARIAETKKCLCELFEPGGEFSQNKLVEKCTEAGMSPKNWETAGRHLTKLRNQTICQEKKLVKVEGKERWTLVVPDDPFIENCSLEDMKRELEAKFHRIQFKAATEAHIEEAIPVLQEEPSLGDLWVKYYKEALARCTEKT